MVSIQIQAFRSSCAFLSAPSGQVVISLVQPKTQIYKQPALKLPRDSVDPTQLSVTYAQHRKSCCKNVWSKLSKSDSWSMQSAIWRCNNRQVICRAQQLQQTSHSDSVRKRRKNRRSHSCKSLAHKSRFRGINESLSSPFHDITSISFLDWH